MRLRGPPRALHPPGAVHTSGSAGPPSHAEPSARPPACDHDPDRPQGRRRGHRRRRAGHRRANHRQVQRQESTPARQRRRHRRVCRRHRRRLHPVRTARGQARAISRPIDPRGGRARQGLAHRPLLAPARSDDDRRRPAGIAGAHRHRRRAGAGGRTHGHRFRRQFRACGGAGADRDRAGCGDDRQEGAGDRRGNLRLHQPQRQHRDLENMTPSFSAARPAEQPDSLMTAFSPREIVSELDRFIVGQNDAKRAVAIALRNRWRRLQLDEKLREEVLPKNILMIGPTGVGKTEISRRLARLAGAPFLKVEATKFTEVGYVGRDVEQIVRDLVEIAITLTRERKRKDVQARAQQAAEDRVLDALVGANAGASTKETFRRKLRAGELNDKEIEIEVQASGGMPLFDIPGMPGAQMGAISIGDIFGKLGGGRTKTRRVNVRDFYEILINEESDKLLDSDQLTQEAIRAVENNGIVFLDEIDKICARDGRAGADVSREGVQRDLLPLIEGTTVATKHGSVKTDHILFIASGAFHLAKPSDLLPELQGRLPIRVELQALTRDDMRRILTEPEASLIKQYVALMQTEGVTLEFTPDAVDAIADVAVQVNSTVENIGARRLQTVMERVLDEISFAAPDRSGETVQVDAAYVHKHIGDLAKNADLSRFIL